MDSIKKKAKSLKQTIRCYHFITYLAKNQCQNNASSLRKRIFKALHPIPLNYGVTIRNFDSPRKQIKNFNYVSLSSL